MTNKIIMLAGLPGSGKSTKAKELYEHYSNINPDNFHYKHTKIWDADWYMLKDLADKYFKDIEYNFFKHQVHILDGLFIRKHHYQKILDIFNGENVEVEFHYFTFDIESCMWNDKYRRDLDSTFTLETALYEYPDLDQLRTHDNKVKLFKYPVERKSNYQMFLDKYKIHTIDDYIQSENWNTGGDWRDYLGDGGEYRAEDPPEEFEELNDVLERIDSNISPTLCQEIKEELAVIENDSERDYYGGCREYAYYAIDVQQLFEKLYELKIIDKNNL